MGKFHPAAIFFLLGNKWVDTSHGTNNFLSGATVWPLSTATSASFCHCAAPCSWRCLWCGLCLQKCMPPNNLPVLSQLMSEYLKGHLLLLSAWPLLWFWYSQYYFVYCFLLTALGSLPELNIASCLPWPLACLLTTLELCMPWTRLNSTCLDPRNDWLLI